ncbi:hypothetical protein FEV09_13355, partial [Pseudanabaena catenata USMAC16]
CILSVFDLLGNHCLYAFLAFSVSPTYDSEYGSAAFMNLTEDIPADLLLRLRPNRCLYKAPEPYSGSGRPRKHGDNSNLPMLIVGETHRQLLA